MSEEMTMLLDLTREVERLRASMTLVKATYEDKKKRGYSSADEENYLRVAGLLEEEREVNAITFDNCGDVAYVD